MPFRTDTGDLSTVFNKGYYRFVVYSWEFDSLKDGDPDHDYFLVFISVTSQATAIGWCPGDGTGGPETSTQLVDVSISTPSASIMPDKIRPLTGEHGDAFGALEVNLGFDFSGISAGISWSQITYQWDVKLKAATTSGVSWRATEHSGCTDAAFIWGYAFGISAPEGSSPSISVKAYPFFYKCEGFLCGNPQIDEGNKIITLTLGSPFPPVVLIQTNPLVGSIILNGTEFLPGQHAASVPGNYFAAAIPPEEYIFDHWEQGGGVQSTDSGCNTMPSTFDHCNPGYFSVTGNGLLRAIFAAKITLFTNPPDIGSISIGTCDNPSHTNGDWVYTWMSLPPEYTGYEFVCAHTPRGYKFDHWSATSSLFSGPQPAYDPYANAYTYDNSTYTQITGPTSITAWFSPKTCCPVVYFETYHFYGGGSILISSLSGENVTNSGVYYPQWSVVNPLAVPREGYVFDRWEIHGLRLDDCCTQTLNSNPVILDITSTGGPASFVTAHFLPKVTFETDPARTGSISWGGCGPTYQGHPDGDWTYAEPYATVTLCANTPTGYRFDHWTTNIGMSGALTAPYNSFTSVTLWSKPTLIKAWFASLFTPTPPSAPSAPSSLVAIGQYGHVDLAWNPPLSDGGSPVTGYQIYRGASFVSLSLMTSIGNQLWYQDTSVTNDQVYYYRIIAVNSANPRESAPSNVDSARPGIDQITISPDPRSVLTGGQVQFSAIARAESGEIIQGVSFSWTTSVPGASVTNAGLFKAGTVVGTFTEEVSASVAGVTGYATVIVQAPPTTRSSTASLSFDSLGSWTWALIIPGALAAGLLGVVTYRKKAKGRLAKRP